MMLALPASPSSTYCRCCHAANVHTERNHLTQSMPPTLRPKDICIQPTVLGATVSGFLFADD